MSKNVFSSKRVIHSLWLGLLIGFTPAQLQCKGEEIISYPERFLNDCRRAYIESAKKVESKVELARGIGKIPLFGAKIAQWGAELNGHTMQDLKNAAITRRFFKSGRAFSLIRDIGSIPQDATYIASVYQEFFDGSPLSFERLVLIMHQRMMDALGFDRSTTIAQFLNIMEKKNKKGNFMYVTGAQFEVYARLIALNLFVTYWYDNHIK